MEYQYQFDSTTGNARAIFSFEHEVFGPWLEVEVGNDVEKVQKILEAIDQVSHGLSQEEVIDGSEYTLIIDKDDVSISTNVGLNGKEMPENLVEQGLGFDEACSAMCGLDDFRNLILSWIRFITK